MKLQFEEGVRSMASIDFVIRARHWHYIGDSVFFFSFGHGIRMHLCDLVNAIKELVEEPGYSPLDWRLDGMEHGGLVDAHEGIKVEIKIRTLPW